MTKRIVSGIFILTALGALGVILAGALTSGEQLIVRFLTAVIVAALGLYVISDLRLQADDDVAGIRPGTHPRLAGIEAPPNSTAAFMATVTSKGESPMARTDPAGANRDDRGQRRGQDEEIEPHETVVGTTSSSTSEHDESAVVEDAGSPDGPPVPSLLSPAPVTVKASDLPVLTGRRPATITDLFARRAREESVDRTWPTFDVVAVAAPAEAEPNGADQADGEGFFADTSAGGSPDGGGEAGADDGTDDGVDGPAAAASTDEAAHDDPADVDGPGGKAADADPVAVGTDAEKLDATDTTDLPAVAVTDFEYSGALEAPVSEWPAAPETDPGSLPVEDAAEREKAIDDKPATADGDAAPASDPVGVEPEVNGVDRPLPAPFLTSAGTSAVDYADAPLAPIIDLRNAAGSSDSDVDEAIRSGEVEVVAALIEQGMLSTDGPISDRDVRTMVYVAFTSNELRKLLLAGGTPDNPIPGIDLGPVELFHEGMVQPPKTLYPGHPVEAEARSQLG